MVIFDEIFLEFVGDGLSDLIFLAYFLLLVLIRLSLIFHMVFGVFCLEVMRDGLSKLNEQTLVFLLEGRSCLRRYWHCLVFFEEGMFAIGRLDT